MKQFAAIGILLLALGSAVFVILGAPGRSSSASSTGEQESGTAGFTGLTVYYFDMGKDCSTCLNLESYTHETLNTYFSDGLENGTIRWAEVDVDLPEYAHFVEDFRLYTKSVVLATSKEGAVTQYDNLSRIWELVYDKDAFTEYVKRQVEKALGADS